jgi:hypothetical protein
MALKVTGKTSSQIIALRSVTPKILPKQTSGILMKSPRVGLEEELSHFINTKRFNMAFENSNINICYLIFCNL